MINDIKRLTNIQMDQLVCLVKLYFKEIEDEILDNNDANIYITNIEKQLEKYSSLHLLVSDDNSKINGFLLGNTNYIYSTEECSFILELYVSKEYRLQGIGRKLVNEFEKLSKNNIYLTSHKNVEKFYTSIGFETDNLIDEDNGNKVFKKLRN